jgi:hypothetical protein
MLSLELHSKELCSLVDRQYRKPCSYCTDASILTLLMCACGLAAATLSQLTQDERRVRVVHANVKGQHNVPCWRWVSDDAEDCIIPVSDITLVLVCQSFASHTVNCYSRTISDSTSCCSSRSACVRFTVHKASVALQYTLVHTADIVLHVC